MRNGLFLLVFALGGCGLAERFGGDDATQADDGLPPAAEVSETALEPLEAGGTVASAEPTEPVLPDATLPPPVGAGSTLGATVVSLGDPSRGGMWLLTPLVDREQPGQVRYQGNVVAVTLLPLDMPPGSGSQISVRALQALGASLTDLVEVVVELT